MRLTPRLVYSLVVGGLVAMSGVCADAGDSPSARRARRVIHELSSSDFSWYEEPWYERAGLGDGVRNVAEDYRQFWGTAGFNHFIVGVAAAGVMAATPADREIQRWYSRDMASERLEHIADVVEAPGEWHHTMPVFAGLTLLSPMIERGSFLYPATTWGSRSFRAFLVGAPPVSALQRVLGAKRPREEDGVTRWRPFANDNGVSGHAFAGSIPFLTAARMSDSPWVRYPLVTVSLLPGWARLNNDDHSISQVALGWYIGYLATAAVGRSDEVRGGWACAPVIRADLTGLALAREF